MQRHALIRCSLFRGMDVQKRHEEVRKKTIVLIVWHTTMYRLTAPLAIVVDIATDSITACFTNLPRISCRLPKRSNVLKQREKHPVANQIKLRVIAQYHCLDQLMILCSCLQLGPTRTPR